MPKPLTIDLTPTWASVLPAFIAVLLDGTEHGQKQAVEELHRMADIADMGVRHGRAALINADLWESL